MTCGIDYVVDFVCFVDFIDFTVATYNILNNQLLTSLIRRCFVRCNLLALQSIRFGVGRCNPPCHMTSPTNRFYGSVMYQLATIHWFPMITLYSSHFDISIDTLLENFSELVYQLCRSFVMDVMEVSDQWFQSDPVNKHADKW